MCVRSKVLQTIGEPSQVEQLLDSGVNVNEQDAFGETALHLACMEGAFIFITALSHVFVLLNVTWSQH